MSDTVTAANGVELPLIALAQTFTYSGGLVTSISCEYSGVTYTQTFTNNGTEITAISQWEPS